MKKHGKLLAAALGVYVLLLVLLVATEARAPDANIRNVWDAIWYSLITMTTVGYGDLSPVTPGGRILGLIFALASIGILTALIGIGLSLLYGQIVPRLRLRLGKHRNWYVFSEENRDSAALAAALSDTDTDCLLVFLAAEDKHLRLGNAVRLQTEPETLLQLRGGKNEGAAFFFTGEDPWDNLSRSLETVKLHVPVYCMADVPVDALPEGLHLFSRREALSRCYWKEHPLKKSEKRVVLIGCGRTGSALLERAILTNVFESGRQTCYHVFEDRDGFAALHPRIIEALNGEGEDPDRIIMHGGAWTEDPELLRGADRIILAADEDEVNLRTYEKLHRWFPTGAQVHVRLDEPAPGLICFGERESTLTPEFVIKDAVNRSAILMNDIYNKGSANPVAWKDLSHFLRQSNIAAADHLIVKARYLLDDEELLELSDEICRKAYARYLEIVPEKAEELQEFEHRRWMRFYELYNWEYDPVRDNGMRRHPLMLPYDELSPEEQRKDAYAWEILGRIAGTENG
ncbi:MAG: ion channel [Candidatus Limivicinus sp.]